MDSANLPAAKRTRSSLDTFKKVNCRKDSKSLQPQVEDAVEFNSIPISNNENGGKDVHKDAGGTQKNMRTDTRGNAYKNLDHLEILCNSPDEKGEGLKKSVKQKSIYKFQFRDTDKKPVEKSESEKELDTCWAQMDEALYGVKSKETDSIQPVVDHDDHRKTETDYATLCSQCNHLDQFLDEQVGMICKSCSVVVQEIRYILPTFVKQNF